jgi:membrane-bound ClpP family serine protease
MRKQNRRLGKQRVCPNHLTTYNLAPEGKVFVHGKIWNAEASGEIPEGTKVKVLKVLSNLKIKVTEL